MRKSYVHIRLQVGVFLIGMCLICFDLAGQNLVPNPDFIEYDECPFGPGQIRRATGWYTPNGRTTDYANACSGARFVGVPQNVWGNEEAAFGEAYAGIRTWTDPFLDGGRVYREYLATRLMDTLEQGVLYKVGFMVSVGDSCKFISDDIGLYFSPDTIPAMDLLPYEPHVSNPQGAMITTDVGWHQISGQYLAKGGESHLVIGNFLDNEETSISVRLEAGVASTYFYIDHVVVEPCTPLIPDDLILADATSICPQSTATLAAEPLEGANYTWDDGSKDILRTIDSPGIYTLKVQINGCHKIDTLEIVADDIPIFDLGNDSTLCQGQSLEIGIDDSVDEFRWNDRFSGLTRSVSEAGNYVLTVATEICTFSDSIHIEIEDIYVQALRQDTLACKSIPVLLTPSREGNTYMWSDLSDTPQFYADESGEYWVDIESDCFSAREYFQVEIENCGCESFFPNVFTPNGDGIHDLFRPQFEEGIQNFSLQVFDRYGRQVFQAQQPQTYWDGTLNGKLLSEGVYYWSASFLCVAKAQTKREILQGHVSLLR